MQALCYSLVGRSQYLFSDGEGSLVEGFSVLLFAQPRIEDSQVMQANGGLGMHGTQYILTHCKGTLVERFGLLILTSEIEEASHLREEPGETFRVPLFADCQRTPQERFGLLVLTLVTVKDRQVVEFTQGVGVLRTQLLLTNYQSTLQERFTLSTMTRSV